ncbi:carbohydrate ABC transporter permease [Occultella gossypii]|uniref:Sugar ABC transporter permease n=1 Tax=Occultella gossypii TaxID=2800820 RepID=A0ABS7S8M8_9MICO|nr:sugar ABC transporter permease [Occultella gossypii]MBZ2196273.1 sugar ABC transporter permease [Occultella gossypii]
MSTSTAPSTTAPTPAPARRVGAAGRGTPRRRNEKAAYIFLLPWFVGLLFTLIPFGASLYLAFTDYNLINNPNWIGLDNFEEMLTDEDLLQALKVTGIYTFVGVPLSLLAALGVALALNKGIRGLKYYRAVYYLPSLLGGSVAIVMLWRYIFGNQGIVNAVLAFFGIDGPSWVSDPQYALSVLISLHVWTFGSPMVIFLAGLRQIPIMYYEAASIDGASRWRQFVSITMPLLSPILFFNLVLALIGSLQTFTQGYILSGGTGGPSGSTLFYNLYLYIEGFQRFDMGYASALAWLLLMIVAMFTAANFLMSRFWVFYDN